MKKGNIILTKENIILKKGDKVYFTKYGTDAYSIVDGYDGCTIKEFEKDGAKITKIERLETIYEAPTSKPILNKEEKEYLEAALKPFKDRIVSIYKSEFDYIEENICVDFENDFMEFPSFEVGTMYKGMEPYKEYTLAELGLFKGK